MTMLLLLLLLPAAAALLSLLLKKGGALTLALALLTGIGNLTLSLLAFSRGLSCTLPIEVHGFVFSFEVGASAPFLVLAALAFLLSAVYGALYFKGKQGSGVFFLYAYLSLSMVNGALLADHLGTMLLFWVGLLCTLFGMLLPKGGEEPKALTKGFTLAATADLLLMLGVGATAHMAHTGMLSGLSGLPLEGLGALGALCLLLGALGKAGCFPFHSWIADGSGGSAPFAAAFPGVLYALLGGYLALRTALGFYAIAAGSALSLALIALGFASLLIGVTLALWQKAVRRSIACISIAQAGLFALLLGLGSFGAAALQIGAGALSICGLQIGLEAGSQKARGSRLRSLAIPAGASLLALAFHGPFLARLGLAEAPGWVWGPLAAFALCAGLALGASNRKAAPAIRSALEDGFLDPYTWLMALLGGFSKCARKIEDGVSWLYDVGIPSAVKGAGDGLSRFDDGSLGRYLILAVLGMLAVGLLFALTLV